MTGPARLAGSHPAFDPAQYHPEDEGKQKPKAKAQPKAVTPASAKDESDPKLQGWKARVCEAVVKEGILTVTGTGPAPFLGVGGNVHGPATVSLRARCADGGAGKVEWLQPGTTAAPAHSMPLTLAGGDWQTAAVQLPADANVGILRVYLPAQAQPVEVDWIELKAGATQRRWNF